MRGIDKFMKKIMSRYERQRIKQRNKLMIVFLGVVLIGLMVFSTFGYAFNGQDNDNSGGIILEYNGIEFQGGEGSWYFNYNGRNFNSFYNPLDVENISVPVTASVSDYQEKVLYFVGDNSEGMGEIGKNLANDVLRFADACLDEDDCEGDFPIKDCFQNNIMIFREPVVEGDLGDEGYGLEEERIYQEGNCIYVISEEGNQIMYADAVLFKILGM